MSIATQIWNMKYQLKEADGTAIDKTVRDTWRRIAKDLASCENDPAHWAQEFYSALEDYKFLPAGRITAGAGSGRDVTLFNCFVMGTVSDSLDGIMDALKDAALTMQQGGGIGYDFSTIRPKGTLVKGVAAEASGPLTFMDVWDAMCRTIMSAGTRRGAMMATLRCDHPDIEAFIDAKRDPLRLRNFNLSVLITDPFMEAAKNGEAWDLVFDGKVYATVDAATLWGKMMQATYDVAEPGVIFIDRINQQNNLYYCETIAATNPCGEQPLPPYGACLLGSINLARVGPALERVVRLAIRMMDNVVDVSKFPLPQQEVEAKAKRRLGLGVTGLADWLIMKGLVYGSPEAILATEQVLQTISDVAYETSIDLAAEKGPFPALDIEQYLKAPIPSMLAPKVRAKLKKHGIRNSHLTSIAPTGTISLYAGNISSGIEPVFAFEYIRKVTQKDGTKTEELVQDYARAQDPTGTGPQWVSAQTLTPEAHLLMQASAQKWIDSSISKTINLPEDISFEDFEHVYIRAWDLGCKGCTTYRPNEVTGSVLSVDSPKAIVAESNPGPILTDRPNSVEGKTYKLKWPLDDHAMYITLNDLDGRPFEIFINSKNVEHFAWCVAVTRMISAVYRRGSDVSFVIEELKAIHDPRGGAWLDGKYVPSVLAAIGGVIEQHMTGVVAKPSTSTKACPDCKEFALVVKEGCVTCSNCGSSKCS